MTKTTETMQYASIFIIGIVLLNLMYRTVSDMMDVLGGAFWEEYLKVARLTLYSVLLGLLLEWRNLVRIMKGHIKFKLSVILPVVLIGLLLYQVDDRSFIWFGEELHFPLSVLLNPLRIPFSEIPLGILSGILLAKSLIKQDV